MKLTIYFNKDATSEKITAQIQELHKYFDLNVIVDSKFNVN